MVAMVSIELAPVQFSALMGRFPEFELSYETISHKKVSAAYNLCLAIPTGKKMFAWFTFHQDKDVCYLLDVNKEKKITRASLTTLPTGLNLSLGTVVYGTYIEEEVEKKNKWFVIEEVYIYQGVLLKQMTFGEKVSVIRELLAEQAKYMSRDADTDTYSHSLVFCLPAMWAFDSARVTDGEFPSFLPDSVSSAIYYPVHHIQYRAIYSIMPYVNVHLNRKILPAVTKKTQSSHKFETVPFTIDTNKPQYRYATVFQVTADIQYDIYHLFAYGKNKASVYYNTAYIPNYKTSVFMNGLFRHIRENKNMDYIEESDDEEEFQNLNEDKYVDLHKVLLMECVFNRKFKRWVPVRMVDRHAKIAHIGQLGHL